MATWPKFQVPSTNLTEEEAEMTDTVMHEEQTEETNTEEKYEDVQETGENPSGFDLDTEMEGIQAAAEFLDPVPGTHIFYVRPCFKQGKREVEEGVVHLGQCVYQVLSVEEETLIQCIGGLFNESFTLGGAVPEYEKYPAAKQIRDGKANFANRLDKFLAPKELKTSERMEAINNTYEPDASLPTGGICAKVAITGKVDKSGEYVNIRKVKLLDGAFPLINTAAEGEEPNGIFTQDEYEAWEFWTPNGD